MRIKAYFYEKSINGDDENNEEYKRKEVFGFKSWFNPQPSKHLVEFEKDVINLIKNIKFRRCNNTFQKTLKDDIDRIKKSDKIIVKADKTSNLYLLSKDEYKKLLTENISDNYKISDKDIVDNINEKAKKITTKLEIENRVNVLALKNAYITLKDHKANFESKPKCRLINPTKSEIGKISKKILEKINTAIRSKTKLIQWTDSQQVIDWVKNLENK